MAAKNLEGPNTWSNYGIRVRDLCDFETCFKLFAEFICFNFVVG